MKEQQRMAQEKREKQLELRRMKIDELRRRDEERRTAVEERRKKQEEVDKVGNIDTNYCLVFPYKVEKIEFVLFLFCSGLVHETGWIVCDNFNQG